MSYDLLFYKRQDAVLDEFQIAEYLTTHLVEPREENSRWFFYNEDTGVYFSIEVDEPEEEEGFDLEGFDNTYFVFRLNYARPSFFGMEAFLFIKKLVADLDLFVLNPQSDRDGPYKPEWAAIFKEWDEMNLSSSVELFDRPNVYVPRDVSTKVWAYNYSRADLQSDLGNDYFVPGVFIFRTPGKDKVFTFSTWTNHIASIIPPADYFLLVRERDKVMVSRASLLLHFRDLLEDFGAFPGVKIIHPSNAEKAGPIFARIKADEVYEKFASHVPMEKVLNARP